jgi:hypothetical protein
MGGHQPTREGRVRTTHVGKGRLILVASHLQFVSQAEGTGQRPEINLRHKA